MNIDAENRKMRIQDVSKVVGLPISTLHYYERIGLVTPLRKHNNYRDYSEKDIELLILIKIMKEYNFSHMEIKEVISRYSKPIFDTKTLIDSKSFFNEKIKNLEKRIQEYQELISIIETFPMMNDDINTLGTNTSKKETLDLIYKLHEKLLNEKV